MSLYQKFGWSIPIDHYLEQWALAKAVPKRENLIPSSMRSRAADACNVATCYYLLGDHANAAKYAGECVSAVKTYFFGDWRSMVPTPRGHRDPDWWHAHTTWITRFSEGLCWASTLCKWDAVLQLSSYPTEAKAAVDGTRQDAAAYLALACFLRAEQPRKYQFCFEIIASGKKQKPKLLAEVITALEAKNAVKFQQSLEAYLRYFRKNEFKSSALDKLLCLDGTTLLNIGRRDGMEFQVPRSLEEHIILLG